MWILREIKKKLIGLTGDLARRLTRDAYPAGLAFGFEALGIEALALHICFHTLKT